MKPPDQQTILRNALEEGNDSLKKRLVESELAKSALPGDSSRRAADTIAIDTSIARMILEEAEDGSPEALALAGMWYAKGIGVARDTVAAAVYDIRAMQFDSPEGAQMLWEIIHGADFFALLKGRVDQDDPAAEFVWAVLHRLKYEYEITDDQALKLLTRSAEQGFVPAQIEMGMCYAAGTWVPADKHKGMRLWEQAAEEGNVEAKIRVLTAVVTAGEADSDAVKQLYAYAANGSVLAETALGYCYENGTGVRPDKAAAVRFYRKAAQRANQAAFTALKRLYDDLRPKEKQFRVN
jgi:TPR repeat protein